MKIKCACWVYRDTGWCPMRHGYNYCYIFKNPQERFKEKETNNKEAIVQKINADGEEYND